MKNDSSQKISPNDDDKILLDEQRSANRDKALALQKELRGEDTKLVDLFMQAFDEAFNNRNIIKAPKTDLQKKFFSSITENSEISHENRDRLLEVFRDAIYINSEYENINNFQTQTKQKQGTPQPEVKEQAEEKQESIFTRIFKAITGFFVSKDQDDGLAYKSDIDLNPVDMSLPKLSEEQEENLEDYKEMLSRSNLSKEAQDTLVDAMIKKFGEENEHLSESKTSGKNTLPNKSNLPANHKGGSQEKNTSFHL